MESFLQKFLIFFYFLATLYGMWDLSSPTRDGTQAPCIGRQILNHWTTREVPGNVLLKRQWNSISEFGKQEGKHPSVS